MKILLFGCSGQVGWELQRSLAPLGSLIALSTQSAEHSADFRDPGAVAQTVLKIRPDIIVNAAAYTAVDKAQSEPDICALINEKTPAEIAGAATKIGAFFIHYSTDYVFDGSGLRPWCEADSCAPMSIYGQTKRAGEIAISASGCDHFIFRTSWVYASRGGNFAKTMLRLAAERATLKVVADQWGAPTGADFIADATAHAIRANASSRKHSGIYHLAAGGETTWHAYAEHVFEQARSHGKNLAIQTCQPIASSEYPTPAKRPLNSRLNCSRFEQDFQLHRPDWTVGVNRMMDEILSI